jgi:hypothetical protein
MMNPVRTTPNAPGKARSLLWPKLVAIFGVTFLLFLVLFLAYDIVTGLGERTIRLSQVSSQAAPIVIDPKIADELAKVLATNDAAVAFDVNDPFVDRAGLSGTVGTTTVGGTTQTTTAGGTKPPSTSSTANPSVGVASKYVSTAVCPRTRRRTTSSGEDQAEVGSRGTGQK